MKTCLAIVVALCAFAAVATSAIPCCNADADVVTHKLPNSDSPLSSLDAESILLQLVEAVIAQLKEQNEQVEARYDDIVQYVIQGAGEAITRWNKPVVRLAKKAHEDGVDVSECVQDEKRRMEPVLQSFLTVAHKHLAGPKQELKDANDAVKEVGKSVEEFLNEAKNKIAICRNLGQPGGIAACLATILPPMQSAATRLLPEAVELAAQAAIKATAIFPEVTTSVIMAMSATSDDATVVVDQAVTCIMGKLGL